MLKSLIPMILMLIALIFYILSIIDYINFALGFTIYFVLFFPSVYVFKNFPKAKFNQKQIEEYPKLMKVK